VATAFTHAFVGGALAAAAPRELLRPKLVLALAALAVLPDADVVGFAAGIPYDHWLGHRGLLHSVPFAFAVGPLAATLLFPELAPGSHRWWWAALLLSLAGASHGLLDALTDAGLGVGFWIPFDAGRSFFGWRPLPTSPIGVSAFFRGPGASILARELAIVWLPTGAMLTCLWQVRRRVGKQRGAH